MTALLRFAGVDLVRGGRLLAEGLDCTLGAGEALHVAGPNGSGKSSLIRLAAGLLAPARGTVERAALALADDHAAFDPERTLADNLGFWSALRGSAVAVETAMTAFGIAHLAAMPLRLFSSGQAKRATLARVAASGAPLWLLDEPLNALDADGAALLAKAIAAHRAAGGAVLAASHQPLPGDWRRMELGACYAG